MRDADRGGRGGAGPATNPDELRAGPMLRWIGRFSVKRALTVYFVIAVLGAVATLVTNKDPGGLLGNTIVVGAVIAALTIRRRALYLLIPLPALTYLVLAVLTGLVHDNAADTSTTQLALNFLQWIGNGFFSLCVGTILVLLIFGARLLASRQLVSGNFPMSAQRPATERPGRTQLSSGGRPDSRRDDRRRLSRAPWEDADPWYDQGPRDRETWNDRNRRGTRDSRNDGDSPQARRPDGRSDNGWRPEDRRSDSRNVPPDRGEPSTRALPPGRAPRPGRDSWDDRRYRSGGASRAGRDSWDGRDPRGR
jgi:hypothetical protein